MMAPVLVAVEFDLKKTPHSFAEVPLAGELEASSNCLVHPVKSALASCSPKLRMSSVVHQDPHVPRHTPTASVLPISYTSLPRQTIVVVVVLDEPWVLLVEQGIASLDQTKGSLELQRSQRMDSHICLSLVRDCCRISPSLAHRSILRVQIGFAGTWR